MVEKKGRKFYFCVFLVCGLFIFFNTQTSYAKKNISKGKKKNHKVAKNVTPKDTKSVGQFKKYVFKRGDTLAKVAQANSCSVEILKKLNPHVKPRRIKVGTVVKIPVSPAEMKVAGKSEKELVYKVKKGDTLYSISKRYNLSEEELIRLNNIHNKQLIAGMTLQIKDLDRREQIDRAKKHYSLTDVDDEDFGEDDDVELNETSDVKEEKVVAVTPPYTLTRDRLEKMLNFSLDFLGTNYKYGGSSVSEIDCSAFVKRVFKEIDINLPRTSREQFTFGVDVTLDELKEGDLLFFAKKKRINHVGIYIGNDMFIHAARKGKGVIVTKLDSPYVKKHFVGAKRLFSVVEPPVETENANLGENLSLAEKPLVN